MLKSRCSIFEHVEFQLLASAFGDSETLKKSLSPNFTPQQGYFSVKSGGSKKQKARKHCVSRAFKHIQLPKKWR